MQVSLCLRGSANMDPLSNLTKFHKQYNCQCHSGKRRIKIKMKIAFVFAEKMFIYLSAFTLCICHIQFFIL